MNLYISEIGISKSKPKDKDIPKKDQVAFCKNILRFVIEKRKFSHSSTSYSYKHILEKSFERGYLTNGAFIQAARELGMDFIPNHEKSINAIFKFDSDDLYLALIKYRIENMKPIASNIEKEVKSQLWKARSKSSIISLKDMSLLYMDYGIEIGVTELVSILMDLNIKIKYCFEDNKQDCQSYYFFGNSKAFIKPAKLRSLL